MKYFLFQGKKLMDGLMEISKRYPQHVKNVRGIGTFCAFDSSSAEKRDEIVAKLKEKGIIMFNFNN